MEAGQRVTLIEAIWATLNDRPWSWDFVDVVLDEFGAEYSGEEDNHRRVLWRIRTLSDDSLVGLHAHLDPDAASPAVHVPGPSVAPGPWEPETFRLFISHTVAHKNLAGGIRDWMRRVGVDAFVAHDTIEPTREWQDEIESGLRTCHAMVALITPDFHESRWCDQEVGVCFGLGTLVVPVRVGVDAPHGFIGKFQALSFNPQRETHYGLSDALFGVLARSPTTKSLMVDPVLRRFTQSWSWDNTRAAFPFVKELPREAWTDERVQAARDAAKTNTEIREGVLTDGRGTPVPVALENHFQALGIPPEVSDDDIPF